MFNLFVECVTSIHPRLILSHCLFMRDSEQGFKSHSETCTGRWLDWYGYTVILHIGVLEHGTPMYQSAQNKVREREEGQRRRRSRREGQGEEYFLIEQKNSRFSQWNMG